MYLFKWMLIIIIFTKDLTFACQTTETVFGWIGSSPVFNYNADVSLNGTVSLIIPTNSVIFSVSYFVGKPTTRPPQYINCTLAPGGDIQAGVLNIQLNPLQAGQQGTYQYRISSAVTKCISLYIYGVPTLPTIESNATVVYEGTSAVLTCSSTSTTVPSVHNLNMNYEWRRDDVTVSTGGRLTLDPTTGRTLTISNINRNDTLNSFSCRATEQGGNTSALSSGYRLTVRYGPDSMTMTPSSTNYTMIEGESMNNITCSATCYPEPCSFTWRKSGVGSSISSTGVLSLGTLQRGDAGTYTCTARNPESNATATGQRIEVVVRYCTTSATLQSQPQVGSIVGGVVPGILLVGFIAVLIYLRLTNRIHFTKTGIESHAVVYENASKKKEIPTRVYEELSAASTTETAATDNPTNAVNYEALTPARRSAGVYSSLQDTTSPENRFTQSSAIGTNDIELQEQSAYQNIRHT